MLKRLARSLATTFAFAIAFVVNPAYVLGCATSVTSPDDNEDEAEISATQEARIKSHLVEMLDELNGTASWQFDEDGDTYEVLVELTQQKKPAASASLRGESRFIAIAHACGSRTFYQSASACTTTYELAVEGTLTLRRLGTKPETIVSDIALDGSVTEWGGIQLMFGATGYLTLLHNDDGSFAVERFRASGLGRERLSFAFDRAR
jgi:hypothetical protein